MTIGQKMHQTLATLQQTAGEMKSYALETQDKNAKKMFSDYADQLENIANGFKGRVNYIEQQEPQYKVFEQAEKPEQ